MTKKRFLLKYSEYETSNGETIESEPYFVDITEEYIDEEYYFTIDGYPTMSDNQVVNLLNELSEENEQLKKEGADVERLIDDLGSEELRRQYEEIINGDVE